MKNNNIINELKRYVLVAEDEFINQEILKEILSSKYEVLVANNGIEALHILETSTKPISLILLDLNMPLMDGFTVMKEIPSVYYDMISTLKLYRCMNILFRRENYPS